MVEQTGKRVEETGLDICDLVKVKALAIRFGYLSPNVVAQPFLTSRPYGLGDLPHCRSSNIVRLRAEE